MKSFDSFFNSVDIFSKYNSDSIFYSLAVSINLTNITSEAILEEIEI